VGGKYEHEDTVALLYPVLQESGKETVLVVWVDPSCLRARVTYYCTVGSFLTEIYSYSIKYYL
jgi:hypothetical protein